MAVVAVPRVFGENDNGFSPTPRALLGRTLHECVFRPTDDAVLRIESVEHAARLRTQWVDNPWPVPPPSGTAASLNRTVFCCRRSTTSLEAPLLRRLVLYPGLALPAECVDGGETLADREPSALDSDDSDGDDDDDYEEPDGRGPWRRYRRRTALMGAPLVPQHVTVVVDEQSAEYRNEQPSAGLYEYAVLLSDGTYEMLSYMQLRAVFDFDWIGSDGAPTLGVPSRRRRRGHRRLAIFSAVERSLLGRRLTLPAVPSAVLAAPRPFGQNDGDYDFYIDILSDRPRRAMSRRATTAAAAAAPAAPLSDGEDDAPRRHPSDVGSSGGEEDNTTGGVIEGNHYQRVKLNRTSLDDDDDDVMPPPPLPPTQKRAAATGPPLVRVPPPVVAVPATKLDDDDDDAAPVVAAAAAAESKAKRSRPDGRATALKNRIATVNDYVPALLARIGGADVVKAKMDWLYEAVVGAGSVVCALGAESPLRLQRPSGKPENKRATHSAFAAPSSTRQKRGRASSKAVPAAAAAAADVPPPPPHANGTASTAAAPPPPAPALVPAAAPKRRRTTAAAAAAAVLAAAAAAAASADLPADTSAKMTDVASDDDVAPATANGNANGSATAAKPAAAAKRAARPPAAPRGKKAALEASAGVDQASKLVERINAAHVRFAKNLKDKRKAQPGVDRAKLLAVLGLAPTLEKQQERARRLVALSGLYTMAAAHEDLRSKGAAATPTFGDVFLHAAKVLGDADEEVRTLLLDSGTDVSPTLAGAYCATYDYSPFYRGEHDTRVAPEPPAAQFEDDYADA